MEAGTGDLGNIRRHKARLELALVKDREVRKCFRGAGLAFCDENLGELGESSGA